MTVATVRSVVARFLNSPDPAVLVLKGAWGVGKTYTWNKLVKELKDGIALPNYSYVSLFGISSLAELRLAILAKTTSVKHLGTPISVDAVKADVASQAKALGRKVLEWGMSFREMPALRNVSVGLEALAPHLVGSTVICLDDLERISQHLPTDELLGFISSLKEERRCKVVLIFNDQRLEGNAGIYEKYREKIVDIELLFDPSISEAVDLVLSRGAPWHENVRRKVLALNIKNIRVLRKIARLVDLVHDHVKDFHEKVMLQAVDTIVLVAWAYYERDAKKPTLEFIRNYNTFLMAFEREKDRRDEKEEDPLQKEWVGILNSYGFAHMDEFDLALLKIVEQGYIEETGLVEQARKLDAQCKASDLDQSFSDAWSLFHETLDNNEEELVKSLTETFKTSVKYIAPLNVNGTVKLLRELGRDAIAEELITYYIDKRKDEPKLFDMSEYAFAGEITDRKLREQFAAMHKAAVPEVPLLDAALTLGKREGWNDADLKALDKASEQEFYDLFKGTRGRNLALVVTGCVRVGGIPGREGTGARVRAALARIASESPVNAIRVNRYLKK